MTSLKYIALILALFLAGFGGLMIFFSQQVEALPVLSELPAFELSNQDGENVGLDSLAGQVWVADFFFTSCGGPCPVMTKAMADVAAKVPADSPVRFVSITVDPETDTAARLREYGEKYGANFERWHFLRGEPEAIQAIAVDGFKVGSVDDPVIHSTRFVLVDKQGRIRGYYSGMEPEVQDELPQAIAQLVRERG